MRRQRFDDTSTKQRRHQRRHFLRETADELKPPEESAGVLLADGDLEKVGRGADRHDVQEGDGVGAGQGEAEEALSRFGVELLHDEREAHGVVEFGRQAGQEEPRRDARDGDVGDGGEHFC